MKIIKKNEKISFTWIKTLGLLILDNVIIITLVLYLFSRIEQINNTIKVICVLFILFHIFYIIFQIKEQIIPLYELEKAAFIVEDDSIGSDDISLEWLENKGYNSGVKRLINCVKIALQKNYSAEMMKSQAEIHALQSQINPHFLYNTLETIRSQAIVQKSTGIEKMTEALATLFRYSISKPGEMASFSDELENVENYLIIQRYRFPNKFSFVKELEDPDILNYQLPILTIQPIVENAIHHGLETKLGPGTITISAFSTQSRLKITINDNGSGISEERLAEIDEALNEPPSIENLTVNSGSLRKKSGIALINVNRRIQFYFGQEYGIRVYSTQGIGTTVELNLPKIQQ